MLLSLIQLVAGIGFVLMLTAWGIRNPTVGMVAGALGTFCWGLVAYGLFNIETVDGSTTYAEPEIALLAAGAAVVCLVAVLVDPWEMISNADDQTDPLERL